MPNATVASQKELRTATKIAVLRWLLFISFVTLREYINNPTNKALAIGINEDVAYGG